MDYTIAESYTLPSLGKVYDHEINPHIKLRSMTTTEEMKRLSPSDRPYENLAEIIDDCLIEKPDISAYDLCVGDFQFLLHKLRIVTYGPMYKAQITCPYCGVPTEKIINLEDLKVIEYSEELDKYFEIDLPISKKHIKLRMQTPRILDEVTIRTNELRKKAPDYTGDPAFLFTLQSLIVEVDGKKPDPVKLEDWIKQLPMKDTNVILIANDVLSRKVGIDTNFDTVCKVCQLDFKSSFRFTSEFFRPTI